MTARTTGDESVERRRPLPRRPGRPEQVRDKILALVQERGLTAGDKLPSESEVCELFGVGRSTAREAMKLLEQHGVVTAEQGRGRFLSGSAAVHVERPATVYESITEMLSSLGIEAVTTVLSVEEGVADEQEADSLGTQPGDAVIRTVRLRTAGEEPLIVSLNTMPRDCLPGPVAYRDWSGSITEALAHHGHHVVSAAAQVSAVLLPDDLAARFSLPTGSPWLLVREQCVTATGRRVLYAEDYHSGPHFTYQVLRRR